MEQSKKDTGVIKVETKEELLYEQNRIITNPVNGGFKWKEPQVQEMKDLWKFFSELRMREEIDGYGDFRGY